MGCGEVIYLSRILINYLHAKGFLTLKHIADRLTTNVWEHGWRSTPIIKFRRGLGTNMEIIYGWIKVVAY